MASPFDGGSVWRCVCVPLPGVTDVTVGVEQLSKEPVDELGFP